MKRILLIITVCFSASFANAQTFDEWFRQKKTQIQYLMDQISALQIYSLSLKKGYNIANAGLNIIHGIKKRDFDLHQLYLSSMEKVNPKLKSYSKIAEIISLQIKILKACNIQQRHLKESKRFSVGEINYSLKVFKNLQTDCSTIIDQLIPVVSDDTYAMKDDERIKRIDGLYDQMLDRYVFIQHFRNESNILGIQRLKEHNDVKTSTGIFGIY